MDPARIEERLEEALGALQRGDHVRALAIADQLTAALPESPVARAIRARALLGTDPGGEAVAEAQRAVELDPRNQYAQRLLGLAAWRDERLTLGPNDLYAQSAMVVLLQDQRKDTKAEALAHLLEGSPGTEEFVKSVRAEARERQIARMLLERKAIPEEVSSESFRRRGFWLAVAAAMIAGMCVLIQPQGAIPLLLCLIVPLAILFCLRQLFFD